MIIAEGYNIALKRQLEHENVMAYLQGAYFRESILSALDGKKNKYPKEAYDLNLDGGKEEREQKSQIEMFKASLTTAMHNFNLRQKEKEQG